MFLKKPATARTPRNVSSSRTLKPPIGGWDARNPLVDMPEVNAIVLDNWFPDTSKVTQRKGHASFSTGMTGNVDSLLVYTPTTGVQKMFAANNNAIYDVSAGGAIGASVASGFTNNQWQYTNIGSAGGQFLFACNGANTAQTYNGTVWAASTLTGPTLANLVWCNTHQRRMWVGEKESLVAYYGGIDSIAGAFTAFPLYGIANKGGYIMGMGTWSRDSGAGSNDYAVFVTSEGQAIIYEGTDPSASATWSLVGVFDIGKPIGRRFFTKIGSDLLMITQDGFVLASVIVATDSATIADTAISAQIRGAVNAAVRDYGSNFGWQPIIYPQGRMILFNIPVDGSTSHQYVFNSITKAPCRFKGMNAQCWAVFNKELYFGGKDGKIYKADTGTSDNGGNIIFDCVPAFSYFGSRNGLKKFNLCQPLFESDSLIAPAIDLCVDYKILQNEALAVTIPSTAGLWDTALWDVGTWGGDADIYKAWRSLRGSVGYCAALRMRVQSNAVTASWLATQFIYENGNGIMG